MFASALSCTRAAPVRNLANGNALQKLLADYDAEQAQEDEIEILRQKEKPVVTLELKFPRGVTSARAARVTSVRWRMSPPEVGDVTAFDL